MSDSDSSSSSYGAEYKSLKQVSREREYLFLFFFVINLIPDSWFASLSNSHLSSKLTLSVCEDSQTFLFSLFLFFAFGSVRGSDLGEYKYNLCLVSVVS